MTNSENPPIQRLVAIMARLRDPDGGCPWDREQTFASLVPHTLEEAYEVAEAVELGDLPALRDELGDLLFQVVFYARLGQEQGDFDLDQVATAICDKLVRRHPHVFGDETVGDAADQTRAWERHKAAERRADHRHGTLDGVSTALPALSRAAKLARRAARVGFDWPDVTGVLTKVDEELQELRDELPTDARPKSDPDPDRIEHELGDLLLACGNLARKLEVDPERALRRANRRFESRFRHLEAALAEDGRTPSEADSDELERLWQAAKREELGD